MKKLSGDKVTKAAKAALEAGEGLLRLAPTWVPRSFLQPGRRLKLHPHDYYALGKVEHEAHPFGLRLVDSAGAGSWSNG